MSQYCINCTKDLSKWNLDFSKDIECGACVQKRCIMKSLELGEKPLEIRSQEASKARIRHTEGVVLQYLQPLEKRYA